MTSDCLREVTVAPRGVYRAIMRNIFQTGAPVSRLLYMIRPQPPHVLSHLILLQPIQSVLLIHMPVLVHLTFRATLLPRSLDQLTREPYVDYHVPVTVGHSTLRCYRTFPVPIHHRVLPRSIWREMMALFIPPPVSRGAWPNNNNFVSATAIRTHFFIPDDAVSPYYLPCHYTTNDPPTIR